MRNVRMDTAGVLRCWKCGSAAFKSKRTLRSKMVVGVGALVTKKKLKCEACGEYNDTGNAQPYKGPASARLGKKYGTLVNMHAASVPSQPDIDLPDPTDADGPPAAPPPPPPAAPAGWNPDPSGEHELRYWDGTRWTEHVSDGGVQGIDALI